MSWVVQYSNYFPREVDSSWPTKELAEARADRLNEEDASMPWEVCWIDDDMGEPPCDETGIEEGPRKSNQYSQGVI